MSEREIAERLALSIIHATGGDPKRSAEAASIVIVDLAALRARDREDGAREMRERAVKCVRSAYPGDIPTWGESAIMDAAGRAIAALPLSARTEAGDE